MVSQTGEIAVLPCSFVEFGKVWDATFPSIFLPFACFLIFGCFWFNDTLRRHQMEMRRWRLIHHYFKHFHDWKDEEVAVGMIEMHIHCRPADFRYSVYPEEMPAKGPTQKKTDEFVHLSSGYLYTGWDEIWHVKKRNIRTVKLMLYGMSFFVICQLILLLSCYILRLDSSLSAFHQKFVQQMEKKRKNGVFCSMKLGENGHLLKIAHRIILSVFKDNGLYKLKWIEITILLLSGVFFILQLARITCRVIPRPLPRLLFNSNVSTQEYYALTAEHGSSVLLFVVYLVVLSFIFSFLTSYSYASKKFI